MEKDLAKLIREQNRIAKTVQNILLEQRRLIDYVLGSDYVHGMKPEHDEMYKSYTKYKEHEEVIDEVIDTHVKTAWLFRNGSGLVKFLIGTSIGSSLLSIIMAIIK